jgi:hypothetical protein
MEEQAKVWPEGTPLTYEALGKMEYMQDCIKVFLPSRQHSNPVLGDFENEASYSPCLEKGQG